MTEKELGEFEKRINETDFLGDGRDEWIRETVLDIFNKMKQEFPKIERLREIAKTTQTSDDARYKFVSEYLRVRKKCFGE